MKLIDKDAVVAEIENLENTYKKCPIRNSYEKGLKDGRLIAYKDALYKINTLEVKEVDYTPMDNDFERDAVNFCFDNALNTTPRIAKTIAKHFFELGLKAQKGEEYEKT